MRIHFIFHFAESDWPLIRLLKQNLPEASFDCGSSSGFGRYKHRIQLFTRAPALAFFAFTRLYNRLKQKKPVDCVCVGSDIEAIGCLLACLITRKKVPIILLGFIYTPRRSRVLQHIRWNYFRSLLSRLAGVICYSKFERDYLPKLFSLNKTYFVSMLFGGKLNIPESFPPRPPDSPGYLVSAGRSGRDYRLLCEAVKDLPIELHIICDSQHALRDLKCPANVKILRNCYGQQYLTELAGADLVLLALENNNLSSGQMVLLDAMALGKTTIITRTATTTEYGEHLKTCYFIEPDSVDAIRHAISECLNTNIPDIIGPQAKKRYMERHTIEPFVTSLTEKLLELSNLISSNSPTSRQ